MTYHYQHLTTEWIANATGASPSTISHWRKRGVPVRYQRMLETHLIDLAQSILSEYGAAAKVPDGQCEVNASTAKRVRPSTAEWAKVRDIITEQMAGEGLHPHEFLNIAALGEAGAWKRYMLDKNCAERLAKHEAQKEKPA